MQKPLIVALATLLLAGCGVSSVNVPTMARATSVSARSAQGIRDGVIVLRKQRFERLDFNHDGVITRDEADDSALAVVGIIHHFGDYDTDADGKITPTEFLREDVIQSWIETITPRLKVMFDELDRNRDQVLKDSERSRLSLFFSLFPKLNGGDLNNDGGVTLTEFEDAYMIALPALQPTVSAKNMPALKVIK